MGASACQAHRRSRNPGAHVQPPGTSRCVAAGKWSASRRRLSPSNACSYKSHPHTTHPCMLHHAARPSNSNSMQPSCPPATPWGCIAHMPALAWGGGGMHEIWPTARRLPALWLLMCPHGFTHHRPLVHYVPAHTPAYRVMAGLFADGLPAGNKHSARAGLRQAPCCCSAAAPLMLMQCQQAQRQHPRTACTHSGAAQESGGCCCCRR